LLNRFVNRNTVNLLFLAAAPQSRAVILAAKPAAQPLVKSKAAAALPARKIMLNALGARAN
jgi:hypothetical protein